MPQMAPISWLILFMIFSFTFIIFNIVNYYNYMIQPNKNSKKLTMNNEKEMINKFLNWKW